MLSILKPQKLVAVCHTCRVKHRIDLEAQDLSACWSEWIAKHPAGHATEIRRPRRKWSDYRDNANIKQANAASGALTITLASLASDTNLLAGRESTAVDNSSNLYVDYLCGGKITTGTSPTDVRKIEVWAYGSVNDTPTYPDVFDGTDSDETVTSSDIKNAGLTLLAVMGTNNTSDRGYWMRATSIAQAFGGVLPKLWGLFVVHNTGVNLNSTGGNHVLSQMGVYYTSA